MVRHVRLRDSKASIGCSNIIWVQKEQHHFGAPVFGTLYSHCVTHAVGFVASQVPCSKPASINTWECPVGDVMDSVELEVTASLSVHLFCKMSVLFTSGALVLLDSCGSGKLVPTLGTNRSSLQAFWQTFWVKSGGSSGLPEVGHPPEAAPADEEWRYLCQPFSCH